MRWLINYIRSCFCKHEWELIFYTAVYNRSVLKKFRIIMKRYIDVKNVEWKNDIPLIKGS